MTAHEKSKKKVKNKIRAFILGLLLLLVVLAVVGGIGGWLLVSREHREAASLPLNAVDFGKLEDGTYHGLYEGGMYQWRMNECDVTVTNGAVTNIQLDRSKGPGDENTDPEMLYERVIQAQSLQIDTISGASLTSKAYLQCVENALLKAQ